MTTLYDKGPFGCIVFFEDGTVYHMNSTAASMLQRDLSAVQGTSVENLFTLPARIFYQTHFYPMLKMQGHAEEIFITLLSADGSHIPVLLNADTQQVNGRTAFCCAFITVFNRKKFEDELVAARVAAEKALNENTALQQARDKIQQHASELEMQLNIVSRQKDELQQFHHVVTHNLKEPLRKVLVYGSIVASEWSSPSLDNMLRCANQLKSVISGLQQYVWLSGEQNNFALVDLNEAFDRAVKQLNDEGYSGILQVSRGALPAITGDIEQLQVLFQHILLNSILYRKQEHATVSVTCETHKQNVYRYLEGKYRFIDFVRITIKDAGRGFDPQYTRHVFGLFRKLHKQTGIGLGLALCKKIVDNHMGLISAETKPDEYTTIIVSLPLNGIK